MSQVQLVGASYFRGTITDRKTGEISKPMDGGSLYVLVPLDGRRNNADSMKVGFAAVEHRVPGDLVRKLVELPFNKGPVTVDLVSESVATKGPDGKMGQTTFIVDVIVQGVAPTPVKPGLGPVAASKAAA